MAHTYSYSHYMKQPEFLDVKMNKQIEAAHYIKCRGVTSLIPTESSTGR